ncbi:MAG: hypothetical protein IKG55_08040 [Solobacterium sp.]|nr:hypothetical protein [Solobacterium sp.]
MKTMKTVCRQKMIPAILILAILFATIVSSADNVHAATGKKTVTGITLRSTMRWTKLCDTKENRAQYVRIQSLVNADLDVKMVLTNGKVWSENRAVKSNFWGIRRRDFYFGKNVKAIYVRANKNSMPKFGSRYIKVKWENVSRIKYK